MQEPTVLGVPPGVAVGTAVGAALGDGGGAVVGAVVGFGELLAPPIPGTAQAPRRRNTARPAATLPALVTSTGDNLTEESGPGKWPYSRRRAVRSSKARSVPTSRPAATDR